MIADHKYILTAWSLDRYTIYGQTDSEEIAIRATERAREKGLKARRFKEKNEAGETVYVVYVLRQG